MEYSSRFRGIPGIVEDDDLISGDNFKIFCDKQNLIEYIKRDFIFKSGVWRGHEINSLILDYKRFQNSTLVVGHSDLGLSSGQLKILKILGVKRVFGVNTTPLEGFARSLPLGLTNYGSDSPVHKILGDSSHFLKSNGADFPEEDSRCSIYVNFTSDNNFKIRGALLDLIPRLMNDYKIVHRRPEFTPKGRINYLQDLRRHSLVLCPEGNGVDTHRFWETLYMGGIPVVTKNLKMNALYSKLPVVVLNNWNELLDKTILELKLNQVNSQKYNFEILRASYWKEKILDGELL